MSLKTIAATIDQALEAAGLTTGGSAGGAVSARGRPAFGDAAKAMAERVAQAMPSLRPALVPGGLGARPAPMQGSAAPARTRPVPATGAPGRFESFRHQGLAGERAYWLYTPVDMPEGPVPLVVMLHGCKQSSTDFATGTGMNLHAEHAGALVVYPEQSSGANGSRCWNWFERGDQGADSGEPAILAALVRELIASHPVDPNRVYVAGLSAGAAMAVILGRTHPELFKAVGVHSGLPYAAAHDVGSAFAAMRGRFDPIVDGAALPVPTIVFHGDRDHTVAAANADEVVARAVASRPGNTPLQACVLPDENLNGRDCSRTLWLDGAGRAQVEQWTLHGAGHAWSGGDPAGSFTDAAGPDASAEMLRFFLAR